MIHECVCTSCGALLELDNKNGDILFCPHCGKKTIISNEDIRFEKFKMRFNEEVREKKVAEDEKDNKRLWKHLLILLLIASIYPLKMTIQHSKEINRLNTLVIEIREDIVNERYEEAQAKIASVRLMDNYSSEESKKWEETRKDLEKLLKEKRKGNSIEEPLNDETSEEKPWYQFW